MSSSNMVPTNLKQLRACLRCSLVKTYDQFYQNGCENCEELNMNGKRDAVEDKTSATFEGTVAMLDSKDSWVARWQGLEGKVQGIYALKVHGYKE